MRKLIALALLVGAVLVLPTMAGAGPDDVKGPACADVIFGSGSTGGVVVEFAAAPCSFVTYTLDVYADAGSAAPLRSVTTYDPLPLNQVGFQVGSDTDGIVCVVLTTSVGGGKHVFDRAPDTGCTEVTTDLLAGLRRLT